MSSMQKIDGNAVIKKMFENKGIFLEKKKEVLNKKIYELQNKINEKQKELEIKQKILGTISEDTEKNKKKAEMNELNGEIASIEEQVKDIKDNITDINEELKELESNKESGKYPIKIKTDFIASNKANKKGFNINEIIVHIDDDMPYNFVDQIDFLLSAINSQSSDLINKYYNNNYNSSISPLYKGFKSKSVVLVEVKPDENAATTSTGGGGGSLYIYVKHVKNTKNTKKNLLNKFPKKKYTKKYTKHISKKIR